MKERMTGNDVRRRVQGLHDLSTIPVLLGKIVNTCKDENSSAEELYKIVSFDQALAERVIRMANSAFFGHSGQIKDIEQATFFLGFDRIRSIAAGMTVMRIFPSHGSFVVSNLWVHSYEVAFLASVLSESVPMTRPSECFLAGLLHDIGRIIFYDLSHSLFEEIETTDTMLEQERERFGCTHADAGAWFAEAIGMPNDIATVLRHHHRPSAAEDVRDFVAIVSLAEALSRGVSPRIEDDGIWTPEHDALLLEFSLTGDDVRSAGEKLLSAQAEIESMFGQS
jgi:putative nucleotidyltransferase with HDIG domain